MKMNSEYGKVYVTYSIFQLNTAFAWEFEYYVNVWTGPRMCKFLRKGFLIRCTAADDEDDDEGDDEGEKANHNPVLRNETNSVLFEETQDFDTD